MRNPFVPLLLVLGTLVWAGPVTVDVGEMPPLFAKDTGLVNRVVERALRLGGYEPTYRWWPVGRMLGQLEDDRLDVYLTPSNTAGQHNPHLFLLSARGVFFYKRSRQGTAPVSGWNDLAGKRVASVTNSPLRPQFEKAGIIVDEGPFETMFDKLDAGRVDFVSTADIGGLLTLKAKFPGRETEFDFSTFSYSEIKAGLFVKDKPGLRQLLEACAAGFAKMKDDGSLMQILKDVCGAEFYRRVKVY
jgi:ABC-type amino acid transport substrate-binding protein